MSCTYGKSDVFRVVENANTGEIPGLPRLEIVPVSGVPGCTSGYRALMHRIHQDIIWAKGREPMGFKPPRFILLLHAQERLQPELVPSPYLKEYVEYRDISMGLPLLHDLFLYITDPAAVGFPNDISIDDVKNSPMRNALRVTYIQQQE